MGLLSDVFGAVKDMVGDALEETPRDDMFTEFSSITDCHNTPTNSVYRSHICNEETITKFLSKWYEIFSRDSKISVKYLDGKDISWSGFYAENNISSDHFAYYSLGDCNIEGNVGGNIAMSLDFDDSRSKRFIYIGKNNKKIYFQFTRKLPIQLLKEDELQYMRDCPTKLLLMSLDNPNIPDSILYTYYDLTDLLSKPQLMKKNFPDFEIKYEEFNHCLRNAREEKLERDRIQRLKKEEEERNRKLQVEKQKEQEEKQKAWEEKQKKQNELRNRQNQLIDSLDDL